MHPLIKPAAYERSKSSVLNAQLGTGDGELQDLCQWDGSKPEGRRCTVKPEIMPIFTQVAHCNSLDHQYGHAPDSASVCSAIAPWCVYKIQNQGDYCRSAVGRELDAAVEAAVAGIPCDVALRATPPPPPDGGASIPTGAIITVLVVRSLARRILYTCELAHVQTEH